MDRHLLCDTPISLSIRSGRSATALIVLSSRQALANRMWDIMNEESVDKFTVINQVKDSGKQKELRTEDDEEDFLDEGLTGKYLIILPTNYLTHSHCESHWLRVSVCPEDDGLPAPPGDHHLPQRDLPIPPEGVQIQVRRGRRRRRLPSLELRVGQPWSFGTQQLSFIPGRTEPPCRYGRPACSLSCKPSCAVVFFV